ncbi:MAG: universal stress protein [Burkholderiaceae bacterium]
MFDHLLLPIDGSPTSELALDKALGIAQAFGSKVSVVYVVDPYPFTGVGADFVFGQDQYLRAAKAEASKALGAARHKFEAAGITASCSLAEARVVWRGILEAAESARADLIVMGSHGRNPVERWVLGSVAQRVVSNAKLPVLVVRG